MLPKRLILVFISLFLLTSCAMFQTAKQQPFSTWSAKKKLTYAINVYSAEYDKYVNAALKPDLTEGQKDYLKAKRLALVGLDQTIGVIIPIIDTGEPLPANLEQQLTNWLTQLGYTPM